MGGRYLSFDIYLDPPLPVLLPLLPGHEGGGCLVLCVRGRLLRRRRGPELRLSRGQEPLLLGPDCPLEVVDVGVNYLRVVFVLGLVSAAHQS